MPPETGSRSCCSALTPWRGRQTTVHNPGSWAGRIRQRQDFNRPFGDGRLPSWGVALLQELAVELDLAALRSELQRLNLRWLPIADAHLLALADPAPDPERFDPFDRLLVAQARQEPPPLVSGDPAMKRYGATVFPLHRGAPG